MERRRLDLGRPVRIGDETRAAVFDMDGLLIDSEPYWRRAEQEVFVTVGVELSNAQCLETTGLRIDEVVDYWYERIPWLGGEDENERSRLGNRIVSRVEQLVREHGRPMRGVEHALEEVRCAGLRIGLATSSARSLIAAVFEALDRSLVVPCERIFGVVCTATEEENGKPAPDVYLTAAKKLGVTPEGCLAFEDSLAGVQSARSAGMKVIAVPAGDVGRECDFGGADWVLSGLDALRLERDKAPL